MTESAKAEFDFTWSRSHQVSTQSVLARWHATTQSVLVGCKAKHVCNLALCYAKHVGKLALYYAEQVEVGMLVQHTGLLIH